MTLPRIIGQQQLEFPRYFQPTPWVSNLLHVLSSVFTVFGILDEKELVVAQTVLTKIRGEMEVWEELTKLGDQYKMLADTRTKLKEALRILKWKKLSLADAGYVQCSLPICRRAFRRKKMRVALYVRVSSDAQDVSLSIGAQLRALREYAERYGYTVVREFVDEAESGRTSARPAFREMIALAKTKEPPWCSIRRCGPNQVILP